jgi:mannosyltransferase PIG-V
MRGTNGATARRRVDFGARSIMRRHLRPPQLAALRWSGLVFLASRVLVIAVGAVAVLLFGTEDSETPFVPEAHEPFGRLGDLLVAGSARWDSGWYVVIGSSGYGEDPIRAAFFPLYPLLIRALTPVTDPLFASQFGPQLAAGMIVSLTAFLVALYLLHRLVALDFGEPVARRTVVLVALFPTAFFFSAVYTEALFLALSVGAVYAARRSHWALAGVLGGLAALTRLPGVLLLVPLGLMLLYGPRGDRDGAARGWRPRHRLLVKDALWLLLVPAGLLAFSIYGWIMFDDALATLHAQQRGWSRTSGFPLRHAWWGLKDAASAINQVRLGADPLTERPVRAAVTDLAFLVFAVVAMVGSLRRLPIAYAAYAPAAVLLALSSTTGPNAHLLSVPRFVVVLFPLFIWLALWTSTPRRWWLTVSVCVVLLAFYTSLFATWHWVA